MKRTLVRISRFFGSILGKKGGTSLITLIYKTTDAPIMKIALNKYGIQKCCSMKVTGELFVIEKIFRPNISEGECLIDIGANHGEYSTILKEFFPDHRILSVEPNREVFEVLQSSVSTECVNQAIGSKEGVQSFFISKENRLTTQASFSKESIPENEESVEIEVDVVKLSTFIKEKGIDRIGLLKIDAEGHDYDVLKSGKEYLREVKFIQFEFNEKHSYTRTFLKDFYNLLGESHLLYRLDEGFLHDINIYHPYLEIFRYQNILGVRRDQISNIKPFVKGL